MKIELFKLDLHNLVEFNVSGSEENYRISSSNSWFLDEQLFYLFQPCFEKSSKMFDYYEPTRYDIRNIVPLLNELKTFHKELEAAQTVEMFTAFIHNQYMGVQFLDLLQKDDQQWKEHWETCHNQLFEVCKKLITLAEQCFNEDKVLWVKGY